MTPLTVFTLAFFSALAVACGPWMLSTCGDAERRLCEFTAFLCLAACGIAAAVLAFLITVVA